MTWISRFQESGFRNQNSGVRSQEKGWSQEQPFLILPTLLNFMTIPLMFQDL
ncbi:MAG: hypothetical protein WCJ33_04580 [Pseudomonadota bacterium]